MVAVESTFNPTYDSTNVLVIVAGEDGVSCGIELIQGTRRDLESHRQLDARPVVLSRIEPLRATRSVGEIFMILQ